ncbi:YjeF family domain-containing protein [Paracoccidioides brasiliensis Pb18]|uniref:NAD(P)H-hydrate epimerase n=1 Tax=Paracoccidioides brasiliensis (strain Pb18) TaxID=502780 RepID=A0A0A0HQV2_PARBD|nr:YjeF family domain-containing protein [Paracoccidioides brasiliensis Pb18]KGM91594.1 YjeF family domain-containing protein [Paracoccidioides brasiliensis Pb18]ODH46253.1 NAD(P)H-hydrate epimerase [Paracoccidioides brasiliensis]
MYGVQRQANALLTHLRQYRKLTTMALKTISAKDAASLDKDLMEDGGFSLDQLMELAGLSVSQAVYRVHPPSKGRNVLVACGPGNNGGDGLVAARHLAHYGYKPTIYYPKQGKNELYERLKTQLHNLSVPFTADFPGTLQNSDFVIDAIFGFSFSGPLRDPFPSVISLLEETKVPVLSVDAPSSWEIETGPPKEGPGAKFMPQTLISLTAAKPLVKWFTGRHFLGGRFLTKGIVEKYGLDIPEYPGIDQIVEMDVNGTGRL